VKCINNNLEEEYDKKYAIWLKNKDDPKPIRYSLPRYEKIHIPYQKANNLKSPKIINQKYLDDTVIAKQDISLIESGLGTGKTRVTNNHIIDSNKKVLSLVHLISLCQNQVSNFNKLLNEKTSVDDSQMKTYKDKDINPSNSVNSTIHSLNNINDTIKKIANKDIVEHFDSIFIDEAHRVLHILFSSENLKGQRKKLIELVISIIRKAKQVIMTDGDFDLLTSDFLKLINRKYTYTKNSYKSFNNIPVQYEDNLRSVYYHMYKNVKTKKYFTCACNTATQANDIFELLLSWGIEEKDIKLYTGDNFEDITDATIDWENKYVIFSPKIVEGVDRVSIEAEIVYQFIKCNTTINIIQLKQQICRNRNIKQVIIYFGGLNNECLYSTQEDFREAIYTRKRIYSNDSKYNEEIENYYKMVDNKFDSEKGTFEETDNCISKLVITSLWINYTLRVNMKSSLKDVLNGLGFVIEYDPVENLKKCISEEEERRYVESNTYNFATTKLIPETDENGLVQPYHLIDVKMTNFYMWINPDNTVIYDSTTDSKLQESLKIIEEDKEDDREITKFILKKLKDTTINKKSIYGKFLNWRNDSYISEEGLSTDYKYTPFRYNKKFYIENIDSLDTIDNNITKLTNEFYMRLGLDRFKINKGNNQYDKYDKFFKELNKLYERRNTKQYNTKMDMSTNNITSYTQISKSLSSKIINFDYRTIDNIIRTNKIPILEDEATLDKQELRKSYHIKYTRLIENLYTTNTYYKWYRCVRYYMLDNETLLTIIKNENTNENKILNTEREVTLIYEFKVLFKKYFPEISLFTLEHTDKGKYSTQDANVDSNDISNKFIPLLKLTGTRIKYTFKTKDDLLKIFRTILSYIYGSYFIDSSQKTVKTGKNKTIKQNSYSIREKFQDILRLILLTNEINNMDKDLIEFYNIGKYKTVNSWIDDSDSDNE
jgi:hypothetical protein